MLYLYRNITNATKYLSVSTCIVDFGLFDYCMTRLRLQLIYRTTTTTEINTSKSVKYKVDLMNREIALLLFIPFFFLYMNETKCWSLRIITINVPIRSGSFPLAREIITRFAYFSISLKQIENEKIMSCLSCTPIVLIRIQASI